MSVARAGKTVATLLRLSSRRGPAAANLQNESASSVASSNLFQQRRWASGGHHGPGVTYEGLTLHKTAGWHKVAGESLAGLMWFWIFVRAYHDGHTLLFGHAPHFEHDAHEEGEKHH